MVFQEAIERYLEWKRMTVKTGTARTYEMVIKQFCLYVSAAYGPDCRIEDIKVEDITRWFILMRNLKWAQNSFIPKAVALRKFFEYWKLQDYQVIDPALIPIPPKEFRLPRVATEEHFKQLMAAIPIKTNDPRHIRNRAIVMMLWDSGARIGEILSLDDKGIDLNKSKAVVNTEKSRGRRPFREIFWSQATNEAMKKWAAKRKHLEGVFDFKDAEAFFISATSWKAGERFTIRGAGEMLRRYCNRAKLPYMNAHSLRHHKGHDIINSGGSAADVMNVLGHSTLASSSVYTMMFNKELEDRARKFIKS
jgi:integrase/recombinase XerC